MRRLTYGLLGAGLLLGLGTGCRAGGCVAHLLESAVGETGDAHCDRRFVDKGKQAAPFCQEIIDTIADGRFQEDCRDKHGAGAGGGRCPFERKIAGCKIDKVNDDGSEVWDWYYDVTDIEADAGLKAGPDGGPTFEEPPHTKDDVRKLCADQQRYEEGAHYRDPQSP